MSMAIRVLMMVSMVACLASIAHALDGQATYYTPPYVPTSCFGFKDLGASIATVNAQLFANGAACGHRYGIRCTGPTNQDVPNPCKKNGIIVTVVDLCPRCNSNQIDLPAEAFAWIANPDAGRVNIEYTRFQVYESAAEEFGMLGTSSA